MYSIKPIIHNNVSIDLPTCMYRMKNVYDFTSTKIFPSEMHVGSTDVSPKLSKKFDSLGHDSISISHQINSVLKKSNENLIKSLEVRQNRILQQLKELKLKLMSMHKELNICAKPAQPGPTAKKDIVMDVIAKPINVKHLEDIVINANPKNVPYSLLAIKNIWKDRLKIIVQIHTHSTVTQITEDALKFSTIIQADNEKTNNLPVLLLSLIWKNISNTELICTSSSCNYSINGEMNILRYLMRIGPNEFSSYEMNTDQSVDIDGIFDSCYQLNKIKYNMAKEKQNILKNLNEKLGKNDYFCGVNLTVCDVAVASALKQCSAVKELPQSLTKWFKKVNG